MENIIVNRLYDNCANKFINATINYINEESLGFSSAKEPSCVYSFLLDAINNLDYFTEEQIDNLINMINMI